MAMPLQAKTPARSAHKEVTFKVQAEGARQVVVTGDFTGWSTEGIRLRKIRNAEWTATLTLAPGQYQYRLLIDGQWRDDPQAERRVLNPFGSNNCVLVVS
jgi:1,4-alpha-glucan branching enzyme